MNAEHSSEEGGEGLREADWKRGLQQIVAKAIDDEQAYAGYQHSRRMGHRARQSIGALVADRIAELVATHGAAEMRRLTFRARFMTARAESAEAERDDLRGRLAAVEALVEGDLGTHDEEGRDGETGSWVRGARHVRVAIRAVLANPSAAQGEAEVGARACRYPCGCDQFPEEHCTCMDGHSLAATANGPSA